ncbi:hypothetical protein QQ045_000196 [Rhodiola kirilowii]
MTNKARKRKSQNSNETIDNAEAVLGKSPRKKLKLCKTQLIVVSKGTTTASNSDSDFEDSNRRQTIAHFSKKQVHKQSSSSKGSKIASATASAKKLEARGNENPSPASKGKMGRKKRVDETDIEKNFVYCKVCQPVVHIFLPRTSFVLTGYSVNIT